MAVSMLTRKELKSAILRAICSGVLIKYFGQGHVLTNSMKYLGLLKLNTVERRFIDFSPKVTF